MKKLFILTGLLFIYYSINCQDGPVTIPSPNVASLKIFDEVPVDYNTGIPNISIPIYEIQAGNLEIPIHLQYHASGIKPNTYPSWVGLNWNLNAGGAITRTVKDAPDETGNSSGNPFVGFFYNYNLLASNNWYYPSNGIDFLKDASPDEFSFSFFGVSGKFYLDHLGQWQVRCNSDIKVICTNSDIRTINEDYDYENDGIFETPFDGSGKMFFQFTLIMENGTKFIFGGRRNAIEFTRPENPNDDICFPLATSWFLTKIISSENIEIASFEYERTGSDLILYLYNSRSIRRTTYNNDISTNGTNNNEYGSKLIEPSYIKSIITCNEKIVFNSGPSLAMGLNLDGTGISLNNLYRNKYDDIPQRAYDEGFYDIEDVNVGRKLNSIQIYDKSLGSETLYKTFEFEYIERNSERLKLKFLKELASNVENSPKYNFEYYTTNNFLLPDFRTKAVDHWGYFNNSIPVFPNSFSPDETNNYYYTRNPTNNPNYYLIDMLKIIVYPTGGTNTFIYEPHEYSEFVRRIPSYNSTGQIGIDHLAVYFENSSIKAGGLRIRKIIVSENPNKQSFREFFYLKNYSNNIDPTTLLSSGQIQTEILETPDLCAEAYDICENNQMVCEQNCLQRFQPGSTEFENCMEKCECNCTYMGLSPYYKSSQLISSNDEIVGTDKYFTANPIWPLTDENGSHVVYGEVVEIKNDGANGYMKLNYNIQNNSNSSLFDELPVRYIGNNYYYDLTSKLLERNTLAQKEIYNGNNELVQKEKYFYNSNTLHKNKKIRTRFYFEETLCNAILRQGSANYIYLFNNYLEKIEKTNFFSNGNVVEVKTFKYGGLNDRLLVEETESTSTNETIINRYKYTTDYTIPASAQDNYLTGMSQMQLKHIIAPVEASSFIRKNTTERLVGCKLYLYKVFHTNVIKPERVLFLKSYVNQFVPASINASNVFTWDNTNYYEEIVFNNYDLFGNLLEYYNSSKMLISFKYGYHNAKYPVIKAQNLSHSALIAATESIQTNFDVFLCNAVGTLSTEAQRTAWKSFNELLRNHVNVKNALLNTYTYSPIIGMTSETDPNGITSFYGYDHLGRLNLIRNDDEQILKTYDYHYYIQPTFYNALRSQVFTRNNCNAGYIGGSITYTVPAAIYSSTISQVDADNKALADISQNGQNYANSNGTCTMLPTTSISVTVTSGESATITFTSGSYTKTFTGSSGSITIPQGTYNVSINLSGCSGNHMFSIMGLATTTGTCNATFTNASLQSSSYTILISRL